MLNNEQLKAVNTVTGPVLVVAGPGAGKTMVIANRIHHMIKNCDIAPENILVVTFSKDAATNMLKRYLSLSSNTHTSVTFGTFHSIFFQILKNEYSYQAEDILSGSASVKLIMSFLDKAHQAFSSNYDFFAEISAEIAYVKSRELQLKNYIPRSISNEDFQSYYKKYCAYLEHNHKLDFEDILLKTKALLIKKPELTHSLAQKYKYILIDEFQDINPVQYDIIRLISSAHNNLFAVGDDDQAIYAFRGATPAIMKKFTKDYPSATVIELYTNYRSTDEILKSATSVINKNTNRFEKELLAHKGSGDKPKLLAYNSYAEELEALACSIKKDLASGKKPGDILIILRTQAEALSVASILQRHGIKSTIVLKNSIYKSKHIAPVIAMLSFAKGDTRRENLLQFMNKPVRYISRDALTDKYGKLDNLKDYYSHSASFLVLNKIDKLIFDMNMLKDLEPAAAIHYIRKIVGYDAYLKKEAGLSLRDYDEAMTLLSLIEQEASKYKTFKEYKEIMDSSEKAFHHESNVRSDLINIKTAHASKGLEFDNVYIVNCTEGNFPHKRSTSFQEIEEERRMFYVAMTRAKERLTLSYSQSPNDDGRTCSRFIQEILGDMPVPAIGTKVYHKVYKHGIIIFVKNTQLTIKFDDILVPKVLDLKSELQNGYLIYQ